MRRVHLFEICDQPWCPASLRNAMGSTLQTVEKLQRVYDPVLPLVAELLQETGRQQVVDLCSGAGGPWPHFAATLERKLGRPLTITLTDRAPRRAPPVEPGRPCGSRIRYHPRSVSPTHVPRSLRGPRTLFGSFHHFRPPEARRILADAVAANEAIGIFEFTERNRTCWMVPGLLTLPFVLATTPVTRPRTLGRYFWTYLVPLLPVVMSFDGVVSCLRSYTPRELQGFIQAVNAPHYRWRVGRTRRRGLTRVTYLTGYPAPDPARGAR